MKNFKYEKKYKNNPKATALQSAVNAIILQDMIRDIVRDELFKILKSTGDLSDGFLLVPANNL